jgi:hypothetical protein
VVVLLILDSVLLAKVRELSSVSKKRLIAEQEREKTKCNSVSHKEQIFNKKSPIFNNTPKNHPRLAVQKSDAARVLERYRIIELQARPPLLWQPPLPLLSLFHYCSY